MKSEIGNLTITPNSAAPVIVDLLPRKTGGFGGRLMPGDGYSGAKRG